MITSRVRKFRATFLIVLGAFVASHLLFGLMPNVFRVWNAQAIDQLFVFRASKQSLRPAYDSTIACVDLNNTTIERLESHYLDRSHFAKVVGNLAAMEVSAQLYDFIFAARVDEESDRQFVDAVQNAKNAYFGLALRLVSAEPHWPKGEDYPEVPIRKELRQPVVEGDPRELYAGITPLSSFDDLSRAAKGLGSLSVRFDQDGVLRRVPLLVRYKDGFYPFLAFRVVCDYLGVTPDRIVVRPGRDIILKDADRPDESRPHDITIPIDRHGNMIVNYIGPWGRMDHYNFADILLSSDDRLELGVWRDELEGRIVVVSDVSTGSTDVGPVPTDPYFPLGGVHANIAHTILTESFLTELSQPLTIAMEALMLLIVLGLSLRFTSLYFSITTGLLIASFVAAVCIGFLYGGVIIEVVRPVMMATLALTAILIYRYVVEEKEKLDSLRQRDFIRSTFGRYLSNEVVEELLGSPEGLTMSGEMREVTFLVSDLRGFTSLSSELTPHEVIVILNRYFEHMIEIIGHYRGTVSEFRGDGMLVFFGAPLARSDDSQRAVACAIHMQNALLDINREQRRQNLPELGMGIGIHTGDVVVGNIGSEKRASYGAVGSPINTAFRIESCTVGGQILISPATYQFVQPLVHIREEIQVAFKGLKGSMTLYDVDAIGGSYNLSLMQMPSPSLVTVDPPVPVRCHLVEGKTVSETSLSARIVGLSETQADVRIDTNLDHLSNVKLILDPPDGDALPLYAKVLPPEERKSVPPNLFRVEFTFVPVKTMDFLKKVLGDSKGSGK